MSNKFEPKTDCFAYGERGECTALKKTYCKNSDKCAFYKTREQREAEKLKYPFDIEDYAASYKGRHKTTVKGGTDANEVQ